VTTFFMRGAARFVVLLLVSLAALACLGYFALTRTTRLWFDADLGLRSRLAVQAAHQSLVANWSADRGALVATLEDIARDERILAAAACARDGEMLASTAFYPPQDFSCRVLGQRRLRESGSDLRPWSMFADLPAGQVHVSAVPLGHGQTDLGSVVLIHDLGYLGGREDEARNFLVAAFFVLSLVSSVITLLAARIAWREWTHALRRALSGQASNEFQPLLRDVRSLAQRLASEREFEARGGPWSAQRLRSTLTQYLEGEQVLVLANREPYIHQREGEQLKVLHPASGLVTAIEPVMRACSGVWVAHGSGNADRETVDAKDRVRVPPSEESYVLRRVWLNEAEEQGYYYGFSNEGLWPLCHVAHARPTFRADDYEHYVRVNRRFAAAVCEEADSEDPIVLVQDYHFALAPRMIRERLPRATIITFWHIPWPNAERIGICPWREELLTGLLGSSIVGFHTQQHCNNFVDSVDAYLESRIDRESQGVVQQGRRTLVRPYPISIEWPVRWLDDTPSVERARAQVFSEFGLNANALLGVGIDRLDYTKGIEERLSAVDELLTRHPEFRGRFSFVQIAAPSRTKIPRYQELNQRVEALASAINHRWGNGAYRPIILLRTHHEPRAVFQYYRAADLCYVSSLHDGMNLVAKEFVAARDDERGVLVLSQFTGAARELTEALVVNPYDLNETSDALAAALRMPVFEQRERMRSMRRIVAEFNVYRWAGRMLVDAAELRRKERMSGRFNVSSDRLAAR
jgi:trehalose 6-phosphate synthase